MPAHKSYGPFDLERIRAAWTIDPTKHAQLRRLRELERKNLEEILESLKRDLELQARSGEGFAPDATQRYHALCVMKLHEIACLKKARVGELRFPGHTTIEILKDRLFEQGGGIWELTPDEVQGLSELFEKMVPFPSWMGERWRDVWSPEPVVLPEGTLMNDLAHEIANEAEDRIKFENAIAASIIADSRKEHDELRKSRADCEAKDKGIDRLKEKLRARDQKTAQQIEADNQKDLVISQHDKEIQAKDLVISRHAATIHDKDLAIAQHMAAIEAKDLEAAEAKRKYDEDVNRLRSEMAALQTNLEAKTTELQTTMQKSRKLKVEYDKRGTRISELEDEKSTNQVTKERDDILTQLEAAKKIIADQETEIKERRLAYKTNEEAENNRMKIRVEAELQPLAMERDKLEAEKAVVEQEKSNLERRCQALRQAALKKDEQLLDQAAIQEKTLDEADFNNKLLTEARSELDLLKAELAKEKEKNKTLSDLHDAQGTELELSKAELAREKEKGKTLSNLHDAQGMELELLNAELVKEKEKRKTVNDLHNAKRVELERERVKSKKLTEHVNAQEQFIDSLTASVTASVAAAVRERPARWEPEN